MNSIGSFLAPSRRASPSPTILWSVIALGVLAAFGVTLALALGIMVGEITDGLLLGRSFIDSLSSFAEQENSYRYEFFNEIASIVTINCGAFVAARHALHAPKTHGLLVVASILGISQLISEAPVETEYGPGIAVVAFTLLLSTGAGELAARWPSSTPSTYAILAARFCGRSVPS